MAVRVLYEVLSRGLAECWALSAECSLSNSSIVTRTIFPSAITSFLPRNIGAFTTACSASKAKTAAGRFQAPNSSTKKEAVSDETASQKIKSQIAYFEDIFGAAGIAVSFARMVSVCRASPRSSSLYF